VQAAQLGDDARGEFERGKGKQGASRAYAQSHSSQISHGASSAHDPTMGGEVVRV
jgi:hypothetical protein